MLLNYFDTTDFDFLHFISLSHLEAENSFHSDEATAVASQSGYSVR